MQWPTLNPLAIEILYFFEIQNGRRPLFNNQNFIRKFNAQKLAITFFQSAAFHKCKSYLLCLEFADKILIFAVLERRLLQ